MYFLCFPLLSPRLSAFVLKCFTEADSYIHIDPNVLQRTYNWLKEHQKSNGEFWEPGRVIHSELQGGNKSPVTLTAYIVTSLLGYRRYQVCNLLQIPGAWILLGQICVLEWKVLCNFTLHLKSAFAQPCALRLGPRSKIWRKIITKAFRVAQGNVQGS